jgi:hypothetical protein
VGKRGFEPRRLAAQDPKSCSSASSDTPPTRELLTGILSQMLEQSYWEYMIWVQPCLKFLKPIDTHFCGK